MPTNNTKRTTELAQADALFQQALPKMEIGVFDAPTVTALKEAMRLYEQWEEQEKMAEVYIKWGDYHTYQEDFDTAIHYNEKGLEIYRCLYKEPHPSFATIYYNIGNCYSFLQEIELAEDFTVKSLKMNLLLGERHSQVANCYKLLATIHGWERKYQKALDSLQKALKIATDFREDSPVLIGEIHNAFASVYVSLGDFAQSEYHLKKGLAIYQENLPPNHQLFFLNYYHLSKISRHDGNYKTATLYLQKAINVAKKTQPDSIYLGFAYHEMAVLYCMQKNFEIPIEYENAALALLQRLNIKKHILFEVAYLTLGLCYEELNQLEDAIYYLKKALSCALDFYGKENAMIGKIKLDIGTYYSKVEEFDTAEQYYQEALQIFREDSNSSFLDTPLALRNLGTLYSRQQKYRKAIQKYHESIIYILNKPEQTDIYSIISLSKEKNDYQVPFNKDLFLNTLSLKASGFFKLYLQTKVLKDLQAALNGRLLAMDFGDYIRQSFHSQESKLIITQTIQINLSGAIRVATTFFEVTGESKYLHDAFMYAEKNKAYLMLQYVQEKMAKRQAELPPELLQLEEDLRQKLIVLEKKIQSEKQKKEKGDKQLLSTYQNDNFQIYTQFEDFQRKLEKDFPDYYQLKYSTATVSIDALQDTLEENQTILSYAIGEDKIDIFIITQDEFEVQTKEKPENWKALIQQYLQSIKFSEKERFIQHNFTLYQLLLQDIIHHVIDPFGEEKRQIFIIPDAELHYLPFETLLIQEANISTSYTAMDYLLNHCQISYHYSATLLYHDLQKQVQAERTPTEITFTGFAPVYASTSNKQKQALETLQSQYATAVNRSEAVRSDGTWMPLPHSKIEVENIAQLFASQGEKSQSFLFESANKQNLMEQFATSRFLLIAAHGIVNHEYPELSGLILAGDETRIPRFRDKLSNKEHPISNNELLRTNNELLSTNHQQDCILNMKEVAMQPMNADLVVLSSCESGIGELHKGEGMMAVNRGFLESGAKNVISTLFKVNDRASSELTQLLFKHILEGDNFTNALQKAKLKLLKREGMSPKMWSGFVLFGTGNS